MPSAYQQGQFSVVTRIAPVREGGRIVVHAYGPYNFSKAKRVQTELKQMALKSGYAYRSEVSCCKLIDTDRMHREAALRAEAEGDTPGQPDAPRSDL